MGIKRLYSYLKSAFKEDNVSSISGKTLGVDSMCFLYKIFFINHSINELDM